MFFWHEARNGRALQWYSSCLFMFVRSRGGVLALLRGSSVVMGRGGGGGDASQYVHIAVSRRRCFKLCYLQEHVRGDIMYHLVKLWILNAAIEGLPSGSRPWCGNAVHEHQTKCSEKK